MSSIVDLAYIIELENGTKLSNRKISSEYNCCVKTIDYISNEFEATGDFQAEIDTAVLIEEFGDVFGLEGKGFTLIMADIFGGVANMKTSYIGSGTIYTPTGGVQISDTITLGFRFLPKNMLREISPLKITLGDFPLIDHKYLGQSIPILIGAFKNYECIPLQKEFKGTLRNAIDLDDSQIYCYIPDDMPSSSGWDIHCIFIDDELIKYNYKTRYANSFEVYYRLTGITRGYDSTEKKYHSAGTSIIYKPSIYRYLIGYAQRLTDMQFFTDNYRQVSLSYERNDDKGYVIATASNQLQYEAYGAIQEITVKEVSFKQGGDAWEDLTTKLFLSEEDNYENDLYVKITGIPIPGSIAGVFFSFDYTHSVEVVEGKSIYQYYDIATINPSLECKLYMVKNPGTGESKTEVFNLPSMTDDEKKSAIGVIQEDEHEHLVGITTSSGSIQSISGLSDWRYPYSDGTSVKDREWFYYDEDIPSLSSSYKSVYMRSIISEGTTSVSKVRIEVPIRSQSDQKEYMTNWDNPDDLPANNGMSRDEVRLKIEVLNSNQSVVATYTDEYAGANQGASIDIKPADISGWSNNPTLGFLDGYYVKIYAKAYQQRLQRHEPMTASKFWLGTTEIDFEQVSFHPTFSSDEIAVTSPEKVYTQTLLSLPTKNYERNLYENFSDIQVSNGQLTAYAKFELKDIDAMELQKKIKVELGNFTFKIQYYPKETIYGNSLTVNGLATYYDIAPYNGAPIQTVEAATIYLLNSINGIPGFNTNLTETRASSNAIYVKGNCEQIFFIENYCSVYNSTSNNGTYIMEDVNYIYEEDETEIVLTTLTGDPATIIDSINDGSVTLNPISFIPDHYDVPATEEDPERPKLKHMHIAGAFSGRIWDVLKEIAKQSCHELTYTSNITFMPIHEKLTETFEVDYQANRLADEREIIKRGPVDEIINHVSITGHTGAVEVRNDTSIAKYGTYSKTLNFNIIAEEHLSFIADFYLTAHADPKTYIEWKEASESFRLGRTFQFPMLNYIRKGAITRIVRQTNIKATTKYLGQIITFTRTIFTGENWTVEKTINSLDFFYQDSLMLQLKDGNLRVIGDIVQTELTPESALFSSADTVFYEDEEKGILCLTVPIEMVGIKGGDQYQNYTLLSLKPNGDILINDSEVSLPTALPAVTIDVHSSNLIQEHQYWNQEECPMDGFGTILQDQDDTHNYISKALFGTNSYTDLMLQAEYDDGYIFKVVLRGSLIQIDAF